MLFSDYTLAQRLEGADAAGAVECVQILARHHPEIGAAVQPIAGGYAVYAGPDSPITQAIALGMQGPVTSADLDQLEHFFESRNAPLQIELCPLADQSLVELLAAGPYRVVEFSNVLAHTISKQESFSLTNAAVQLREVANAEVDLWARIITRGFVDVSQPPQSFIDVAQASYHIATATSFLATVDGQPAGGGTVAVYDKVATLFGQSTLKQFRNRGVQTAVIGISLAVAVRSGCDLAMMCALPGSTSQRNAERHGFRVCYTRTKLEKTPDLT